MLANAATLPADQVFLDLEDAVAPGLENDATRQLVVNALRDSDWTAPTRVVRINAVGTPWCLDDLLAIVSDAGDALACVMVPKVESAAHIQFVAQVPEQLDLKHEFERPVGIAATDEHGHGAAVFESEMIDEASRKMAASFVERGRAAGMTQAGS
jgi:citrate lyase subunit beta/citryl-CoA lyase